MGVAARELERARVDVIVAAATSVSDVAKRETSRVPIVFIAGADPVTAGLVESFAKPGGRLTGLYSLNRDLTVKRLEVLRQSLPKVTRLLTIYNPDTPYPAEYDGFFQLSDAMVVPMMSHETSLCDKGALLCYGQNYGDLGRLAAKFVQRILAGTSPKDLPVESYSKIELLLNLRTAKQVGVSFSQPVPSRADRVVE